MAADTWIFFTDLFGEQRWLRQDARGTILTESSGGFVGRRDCVSDATQHGYAELEPSLNGCPAGDPLVE